MLKKFCALLAMCILLLLQAAIACAAIGDESYPWRHHEAPYDFKFGAMIDSHQQSFINKSGILQGFIYIQRTGELTEEGYEVAEKAHCSTGTCTLGWVIKGLPVRATLVHTAPRVWQIDPSYLPEEPGYNHFQWVGPPKTPHELVVGETYDGYLLKRVAPEPFFWLGGGPGEGGEGGHDGSDTGGCSGHDGTDEGGCSGHDGTDEGGCSGHDSGPPDDMGSTGGSSGRPVSEGVDPHRNFVTEWTGDWTGNCGGHEGDEGGCGGHEDGSTCEGH